MPNILRKLNSFTAMRVKYGSYAVIASTRTYTMSATVVAGGGGGGFEKGGGGAGGLLEVTNYPVIANQNYTVVVGAGGVVSTTGVDSSFATTEIAKGGAGSVTGGVNGGSGSGGWGVIGTVTGGSSIQTSTVYGVGYGNSGGSGRQDNGDPPSGGGGGAGAVGNNGNAPTATGTGGDGGAGRASAIDGLYYAGGGGGGGGASSGAGGSGGNGGGAAGSARNASTVAAVANKGGGGGGTCGLGLLNNSGTRGYAGSGIVILKIPLAQYSGVTTGTPAVDLITAVGFVILTYTGSGSYTA